MFDPGDYVRHPRFKDNAKVISTNRAEGTVLVRWDTRRVTRTTPDLGPDMSHVNDTSIVLLKAAATKGP